MDMAFADVMEVFVTPITVLVGLLGNVLSICVLRKREIQLRSSFARILIALAVFDITFIAASGAMFSLRALSDYYRMYIYPYTVPILLPVAQIAMTASVYTTVVTCFDRYIAICRPALLGCCGRSEEKTSWSLIIGTAVFSVLYNLSRFFEYKVMWVTTTYSEFDPIFNETRSMNMTELAVIPTDLRENLNYIQYYILLTNFIFMGICPIIVMITFNVLVVRAVQAANQRRARMSKRQQRNITVTSMLVSVVLVFLICHSVKLIINCYEVYQLISDSGSGSTPTESASAAGQKASSGGNYTHMGETSSMFDEDMSVPGHQGLGGENGTLLNPPEEVGTWPLWVDYMTIISHWLLILNSSCNIAIYLHKDPKFKAVLKDMMFNFLKIPHISLATDEEESRTGAVRLQLIRGGERNEGVVELEEVFEEDLNDESTDDQWKPTRETNNGYNTQSPNGDTVVVASTKTEGTMTRNQYQHVVIATNH